MFRVLAFLAWPLIEIALFVVIGGEIGLWATLGWIFVTAVVGVVLLRTEAERGARVLRGGLRGHALPEGAALAGLFRALAAVLLMLPGFFGDAIGLLLLLPPVQGLLAAAVLRRVAVFQARAGRTGFRAGSAARGAPQEDIIDGEWVEVPPEAGRNRRPSGWTEAQIEAQVVDDPTPRGGPASKP